MRSRTGGGLNAETEHVLVMGEKRGQNKGHCRRKKEQENVACIEMLTDESLWSCGQFIG